MNQFFVRYVHFFQFDLSDLNKKKLQKKGQKRITFC